MAKKNNHDKPVTDNVVPEGYESYTAEDDFGVTVDFEKTPIVEGVVKEVKAVEFGKGRAKKETRVLTLITNNGLVSVWESTKLRGLFDEVEKDTVASAYIEYLGNIKIAGRKMGMKNFKVGIKRKEAARSKK